MRTPRHVSQAADWFARRKDGPLSAKAEEQFLRWWNRSASNRQAYAFFADSWKQFQLAKERRRLRAQGASVANARSASQSPVPLTPTDPAAYPAAAPSTTEDRGAPVRESAIEILHHVRIDDRTPALASRRLLSVLLVSVGIAAVVVVRPRWRSRAPELPLPPAEPGSWKESVSGPFDRVQTIELADGSTLRLNADSLVKVRQSAARREVILVRGQVAFDVMTDPRRPFDVISDHVRVSVTGTQFTLNRRSFDDVEALVSDGTVVLIREAARAERVELQSGDVMRVKAGRLKPQARLHANDDPRLAWLKEQLSYVNPVPLRQVVEEFNRYNEFRLRIVDPSIEEVPVCGIFNRRDPEIFAKGLRGQQIEHQVSVSPATHRREILLRGVAH